MPYKDKEKRKEYQKRWKENNRERYLQSLKEWRRKANREEINKEKKEWRRNNWEKFKEYNRKCRENNKEKYKATLRRWILKQSRDLTDYYVKTALVTGTNLSRKIIPQELIEAYRYYLLIKRFLRSA